MAQSSKKFSAGPRTLGNRKSFTLFHNEMVCTNNIIILKTEFDKKVYSTSGNPNSIKGNDHRITRFIKDWSDGIQPKSQPISIHAEKSH